MNSDSHKYSDHGGGIRLHSSNNELLIASVNDNNGPLGTYVMSAEPRSDVSMGKKSCAVESCVHGDSLLMMTDGKLHVGKAESASHLPSNGCMCISDIYSLAMANINTTHEGCPKHSDVGHS